jgi:hypothetical protein
MIFVKMNKDVLKEDTDNDKKAVYLYHVLVNLIQQLEKVSTGMGAVKEAKVVAFDDKDAESELVHGITINPAEKRISVIFRGSVTTSDWYKNVQVWASKHPNPLKDYEGQPDTLEIHSGFYGESLLSPVVILFGQDRLHPALRLLLPQHFFLFAEYMMKENDDGGRSKFENILRTVKRLCKRYPKFTIYCSGHR